MKKITLCLMLIFVASMSWSQCTNGVSYQGTALVNDGSFELQSNCNYTGEYSNTSNIIDGNDYRFLTSTGTDFITVTSSDGTIVYGFGPEPLLLTIDTSSDLNDQALRVYYHDDSTCATTPACRATAVQNVTVAADLCPDPVNFGATAITDSTADLVWGEAGVSTVSYNVEVYASGESAANGDTPVFSNAAVAGFSVVASGLMESTTYDAYIMTTCSGATAMSNLVGPQTFTTASLCDDVSGLIAENVTTDQADISFTPGNSNDSFLVEVYASGESAANGDTPIYTNSGVTVVPETATGLSPTTTYDAYVTGFCGATSTVVQGPESFTTLTPPPVNDECANAEAIVCGGQYTGDTTSANPEDPDPGFCGTSAGSGGAVWYKFTGQNSNDSGAVLGSLGDEISLDLSLSAFDTKIRVFEGSCDALICVGGNDDGGAGLTSFLTLPTIVGTEYYVLVYGFGSSAGLYTLDVTCTPPPSCPDPTELNATNIMIDSADLEWVIGSTETLWDIELVDITASDVATGSPTATGVSNPYTVNGLISNNEYEFYVRADCLGDGTSLWVGPYAFRTTCDVFTPDYSEPFDAITPDCWEEADNGDEASGPLEIGGSSWTADGFLNNGFDGAYKINLWVATKSDWLLSPVFDLTGGPFQVEFDFGVMQFGSSTDAGTLGSDDTVKLLITTDNGTTWTTLLTYDNTSVIPVTGETAVVTLEAYAGQTVQFGILGSEGTVDDPEDNDVFVDNFRVRGIPPCLTDSGTLTADASPVFLSTGGTATISATVDTAANVPEGYQTLYVLTSGANLLIEQVGALASFSVSSVGDYTIHTLVYDPNTLDPANLPPGFTGFDVNDLLIQGGGTICASLDVTGAAISVQECLADAGTLTADASPVFLSTGGTATISATVNAAPNVPTGYETLYVLTAGAGLVIEQAGTTASFDVTSVGSYTIHTLVYDPTTLDPSTLPPGATGFDVNTLLIQGGGAICGALDVTGAAISVEECVADAGTLTADATPVFLSTSGSATISATVNAAPNVPTGYETLYVLTEGAGLVIEQAGTTASFDVTSAGSYTIHTLVYDPMTLDPSTLPPGATGFDVNDLLIQGGGAICGALDVTGAAISVEECVADAGTLTADSSVAYLVAGTATISATVNAAPNVPTGYETLYVLTEGAGLVIEQAGTTASFDVTSVGSYTIHTLVYDPMTLDPSTLPPGATGFDVNDLLIQGGGAICGALDVTGAAISVEECVADAGTLTADSSVAYLVAGTATISATVNAAPNVPTGYETLYVLTEGAGLVIEQAGTTASFDVTSVGSYTIHTLVYDPTTLDPSTLPPGATGFDVNDLLIQGGGAICGALDVTGAAISVQECAADAGTLTADATPVFLSTGGTATISASVDTAPNLPADFEVLYVLTSGADLLIEQVGAISSFSVSMAGDYTIHTLVYNPATLDPGSLPPGATGFDVNDLLIQGGGAICAALDVAGAAISVEECLADAGTLTADASPVELEGGTATVSATIASAPNVPAGYEILYVLTEGAGLVIEQAGASPSFVVTSVGSYTIHTLVYDPLTLDPGNLPPGATGFDVNALLVQGGGSICGALDVTGAAIVVEDLLGIDDVVSTSFTYYPNPVQHTLTLNAQNTIENVTMYNMLGQVVLRATPNSLDSELDMSDLQNGAYFVNVTIANITKTVRVLKE